MWLKRLTDSSSRDMSLERIESWNQSSVVEAYESISWIKYADWLSMGQFEKGGVIERMGISNMIL